MKNKNKYGDIIENPSGDMKVINVDQIVLKQNTGMKKILGYDQDEAYAYLKVFLEKYNG